MSQKQNKTTSSEDRKWDQYVLWQLVALLRNLRVSLTPTQQKLVESRANLMATIIKDDIAHRDKLIEARAERDAYDLLRWKYKELNDQTLDMQFVEAHTVLSAAVKAEIKRLEGEGE